ncbi:FHA domain-containing protein [Myxococcus sp. CA040A]|uniref:FHA domain-containing protein n=1 Tax=Myxococcus sp. CA040A TaxID=2741738 RepID=UPI00157B210B|nr:FHA domain-containing protein [Myxococcus sp. CA040A]NTX04082.1 FHA domain-containing protein [Myxococcus sp. CA040A]
MAPANPKRPPRPPRPPGTQAPKEPEVELPFDDDEVAPLQADDPRPQRVPQFPAGSRKGRSKSGGKGREKNDRELSGRFDWGREYSNPGHPPAFLYVERGPGAGQLVPVQQGPLVLGRSSSSDLRLQHPSISRRHAQITRQGDQVFIKDLGSQNGTFINRNRVTDEVEVMQGDEITLGNAMLRLRGPGGTPAAGIPALTGATPEPLPRKRGLGPWGVGLVAAGLGSTVAALITVLAVGLSSNRTAPTNEATRSGGSASTRGQTPPSEPAQPEDDRPLLVDTGNVRPTARATDRAPTGDDTVGETPARTRRSGTERDEPRAATRTEERKAQAAPSGDDDSRAPDKVRPSQGGSSTSTAGLSARDIASGATRASRTDTSAAPAEPRATALATAAARPSRTDTAASPSSLSASDLATGAVRAPPRGTRDTTEEVPAFQAMSSDDEAVSAEKVVTNTKARDTKPLGPPTEAEVLRLYEAGEVTSAMEMAKSGRFTALHAKLVRFDAAGSEARKALAKGDTTRAITQLTVAVNVDQELSRGWSRLGPQLRAQLSTLYVRSGADHMKAQDSDAARSAFQQALKYDAGNRRATEGLRRLDQAP